MKDLEKKIEEAAKRYSNGSKNPSEYMKAEESAWENGALSNEAKAFHQQGMYTEEEVQQLLISYALTHPVKPYRPTQWFEQNKKK